MKKITFIYSLAAAFLLQSCATAKPLQTITLNDPVVFVSDSIPGTKDELFIKANEWLISIFKDSRSIIQFSDKTEGVLIGKYLMLQGQIQVLSTYIEFLITDQYYKIVEEFTYAIIDIKIKDNKARISIKPDTWHYQNNPDRTIESVIAQINKLCDDFFRYLHTSSIEF
jgi:hypothetical protein